MTKTSDKHAQARKSIREAVKSESCVCNINAKAKFKSRTNSGDKRERGEYRKFIERANAIPDIVDNEYVMPVGSPVIHIVEQ